MTDTTTRELIQRLADELPLANKAHAFLDQSGPNAPTVEDLQAQIQALRADYLRMANVLANQVPYRNKLFADLIPDCNEDS